MSTKRAGSDVAVGPRCGNCGNDLRYVGDRQLQANNMHHQRTWICANPHCETDDEVVYR